MLESLEYQSQCDGYVEVRENNKASLYQMYGSIMFLGIFVGTLFLMGAVMIIYYKQISEGFDDRKRFQIMQKVGMSRQEVRQTIRSQVVTVFFLPLVVAILHTVVAFPVTRQLMTMMNFPDSGIFPYNPMLYRTVPWPATGCSAYVPQYRSYCTLWLHDAPDPFPEDT